MSQKAFQKSKEVLRPMDFFWEEKMCATHGVQHIAGVDEVGYGAWAGPVVVASVVLAREKIPIHLLSSLQDSKKLSPHRRQFFYDVFLNNPEYASWTIAHGTVEDIFQTHVLHATLSAMEKAVSALPFSSVGILLDGRNTFCTPHPILPIIRGDTQSPSIAVASIIAKVTRDALMDQLHQEYPHFAWNKNKGYGTAAHSSALKIHGFTPHHRQKYRISCLSGI